MLHKKNPKTQPSCLWLVVVISFKNILKNLQQKILKVSYASNSQNEGYVQTLLYLLPIWHHVTT
jgi:hypothetical protein